METDGYYANVIYQIPKLRNRRDQYPGAVEALQITKHVVQLMESWGHRKIYYHDRDALPGIDYFTEFFRAVKSSKHTVIVITENFKKNSWGMYKSKAAFMKMIERNNSNRFIALCINLEENDIPDELNSMVRLEFGTGWKDDDSEWEKLRKLLLELPIQATEDDRRHNHGLPAIPQRSPGILLSTQVTSGGNFIGIEADINTDGSHSSERDTGETTWQTAGGQPISGSSSQNESLETDVKTVVNNTDEAYEMSSLNLDDVEEDFNLTSTDDRQSASLQPILNSSATSSTAAFQRNSQSLSTTEYQKIRLVCKVSPVNTRENTNQCSDRPEGLDSLSIQSLGNNGNVSENANQDSDRAERLDPLSIQSPENNGNLSDVPSVSLQRPPTDTLQAESSNVYDTLQSVPRNIEQVAISQRMNRFTLPKGTAKTMMSVVSAYFNCDRFI